jgi:lycopene cyclase domain-containing protein
MIPSKFEYLLVLAALALAGSALFPNQLAVLVRSSEFWCAYLSFLLIATAIDVVALILNWWSFTSIEVCGLSIWKIPIEEFLLFSLMFGLVVASWEAFETRDL